MGGSAAWLRTNSASGYGAGEGASVVTEVRIHPVLYAQDWTSRGRNIKYDWPKFAS